MLTGNATPYLHNGVVQADLSSNFDVSSYIFEVVCTDIYLIKFGDGKVGILDRTDIGLLVWDIDEEVTETLNLGSRLKTPVLPIWVSCINNNWGVLFNPREDLMRSHIAENR